MEIFSIEEKASRNPATPGQVTNAKSARQKGMPASWNFCLGVGGGTS
jgi:hypothetical protein